MKIKITEKQLEAIVAEARTQATMRGKKKKSSTDKEYGKTVSKVIREEGDTTTESKETEK